MAIEIITSERKRRSFLVYDGEWIPGTLQMRVVGVYDGAKYRCYTSVRAFLYNELTDRNRGRWFYAHAGGLADVQFVLEEVVKQGGFTVKASFSGSSAIIVHVTKGKNTWHFVDSYWLLRDKLANIAKMIGMRKTGPEKEGDSYDAQEVRDWYANAPLYELIPYNRNDCVILWKAIEYFQNALWELGGQLQMTLASSAMQLFRRHYLKNPITTRHSINERASEAYTASRVEVFNADCKDSYYYDINSSFPYAMTKPCPGEVRLSSRHLPTSPGDLYMADVEIETPEDYITPTPKRVLGRVFFPIGRWRTWLTNVDIELLLREGGKILKCHECIYFEPFYDLAEYAKDIYNKRKAATSDAEKYTLKILLNSLYGKFAESEQKMSLHLNPPPGVMAKFTEDTQDLFPGAYLNPEIVEVPHQHIPISAHITALARQTLFDFLIKSGDFHYCDTDGFSTGDLFSTGPELGQLKLEKRITSGLFVAPKLYNLHGQVLDKGGNWKEHVLVKAKGFSLGRDDRQAEELFFKLVEDGEIRIERMSRVRENFRKGAREYKRTGRSLVGPTEAQIIKRLKKDSIGKRFMYPDGSTRPWHLDELEGGF